VPLHKARERLTNNQGQQIRLKSEADGYSPDDREWKNTAFRRLSDSMRPDSSLFIV